MLAVLGGVASLLNVCVLVSDTFPVLLTACAVIVLVPTVVIVNDAVIPFNVVSTI